MQCFKGELPEFKRCCFCIPLRFGLLTMGYIKLVLAVMLLYPISVMLFMLYMFGAFHNWSNSMAKDLVPVIGLCAALFLDISFNLVFIVAAHTKNYKMLRVYNRYAIFTLIATTLLLVTFTCLNIYSYSISNKNFNVIYYLIGYGCSYFLIQFYLILMIRSEIMKLRCKGEFRFVNNEAEARCTFVSEPQDSGESEDTKTAVEIN